MSWGTNLADQVVQTLNNKSGWSIPFTAKRVPFFSAELSRTQNLQVQALCASVEEKRRARRFWLRRATVQIALFWHANDPVECTARLGTLADEIGRYLIDRSLNGIHATQTNFSRAAPTRALQEQRICSCVLSVVYDEVTTISSGISSEISDTL